MIIRVISTKGFIRSLSFKGVDLFFIFVGNYTRKKLGRPILSSKTSSCRTQVSRQKGK